MNIPNGATHYILDKEEEIYHYYRITEEGVCIFLGHLGWILVGYARDIEGFLRNQRLTKIIIEPRVFELCEM